MEFAENKNPNELQYYNYNGRACKQKTPLVAES